MGGVCRKEPSENGAISTRTMSRQVVYVLAGLGLNVMDLKRERKKEKKKKISTEVCQRRRSWQAGLGA